MNIPYIVLCVQVVILSLFWYMIAIRKVPFASMNTGLPDRELLVSFGSKITNTRMKLSDGSASKDTVWTSDRVVEEIKKNQMIRIEQVGMTPDQVTSLIKANAQPKVWFDVSRNNSMKQAGVITYAAVLTQSTNSGMDLATGVFTAPLGGLYRMTFTALRYYFVEAPTPTRVVMKHNGKQVAVTASTSEVRAIDLNPKPPGGECLSINCLLNLARNDKVLCEIEVGGVYDTAEHHVTHFTGELMIEK